MEVNKSNSPAGYITQDPVIKQDVLLPVLIKVQTWNARGVMVDHHNTWTVQSLGLMDQQVTALVIHIIGNYKTL